MLHIPSLILKLMPLEREVRSCTELSETPFKHSMQVCTTTREKKHKEEKENKKENIKKIRKRNKKEAERRKKRKEVQGTGIEMLRLSLSSLYLFFKCRSSFEISRRI